MPWLQHVDPLNNPGLSAAVAVVPVLFIFWALIIKKMKGYQASLIACLIAFILATTVYGMPLKLAALSAANGALYGLFPICWIIIAAVFLFNITVQSGQFEVIKHYMASITADRRLQALLISFSFGAFLEGTAGFGAPVAITAAMLVGLGFNPMYAAGICLIANTAPVAFGSVGIPIIVASQISGLPEMSLSQMVGRTLPLLSVFVPFYLVVLMSGFKRSMEVIPAVLVSGLSFSLLQLFTSNFLGPALPDVIAGLGSIIILTLFLKIWQPREVWRFKDEVIPSTVTTAKYNNRQIITAWSPFLLLTLIIITWGLPSVKEFLNMHGQLQFNFPGLNGAIADAKGNVLAHVFKFNYLSAAGSAIFISALIAIPLLGFGYRRGLAILGATLKQLRFPILTVMSVLAFAYIVNDSGITTTIGLFLARSGALFPFFAPVLGWLGVFITGSDTSANALFGKLQAVTATSIGVPPVVTVGANISGGVVGKMISPQSIAVAAAAGDLVGRESDLFRFTVKHSFFMLLFICLITLAQAYLIKWVIPIVQTHPTTAAAVPTMPGYVYLLGLLVIIAIFVAYLRNGSKKPPSIPR